LASPATAAGGTAAATAQLTDGEAVRVPLVLEPDTGVRLAVSWSGGDLDMQLVAPGGDRIPATAVARHLPGTAYQRVRLGNGTHVAMIALPRPVPGPWQLRLSAGTRAAVDRWHHDRPAGRDAGQPVDDATTGPADGAEDAPPGLAVESVRSGDTGAGGVRYRLVAVLDSPIGLQLRAPGVVTAGAPFTVRARLGRQGGQPDRRSDWATAGAAPVTGEPATPGGGEVQLEVTLLAATRTERVPMEPSGDGEYTAQLVAPRTPQPFQLSVRASGRSPAGARFTRRADTIVLVDAPP
jgi:hypothetical protein